MDKAETNKSSSSGKTSTGYVQSYDYGYDAQAGMVEVFTTAGKVNLRSGPGRKNGITNNVPKRGTSLGELLDSEVDASGNVWFKVRYKNRTGWITSDFAQAVPGAVVGSRSPQGNGKELSAYFMNDYAESVADLELRNETDTLALNDHMALGGGEYVDAIEVYGKDYTVFGVEVGMTANKAKSLLKSKGLYCSEDSSNLVVFVRPCTPDAISVSELGFDAYLELVINSKKCVEAINLYRY